MEFIQKVRQPKIVNIEPETEDDWEIMQLHAELLEQTILSQCRVVSQGSIIPIWIKNYTLIKVKISNLSL